MKAAIEVERLGFSIQGRPVLTDICLYADRGEFVGVIGPNGSGKSTLLKNICKVYTPSEGTVRLAGKDTAGMTCRQAANEIAVVAQENGVNFDFSVEEVVAMGRYPKKKMLDALDSSDRQVVAEAMLSVEMQDFANRSFLSLSGGEKQRILIARALAQQTDAIILDEPTNHLDIGSRISALRLIKNSGKTVLAALHDLETAAHYCNRIYALLGGRVLCSGTPSDIIKPGLIQALYGTHADVFRYNNKLFLDYVV